MTFEIFSCYKEKRFLEKSKKCEVGYYDFVKQKIGLRPTCLHIETKPFYPSEFDVQKMLETCQEFVFTSLY